LKKAKGCCFVLSFFEMVFMSEILLFPEKKIEEGEWEKER